MRGRGQADDEPRTVIPTQINYLFHDLASLLMILYDFVIKTTLQDSKPLLRSQHPADYFVCIEV